MAFLDEIRERKLAVGIAGTVLLVAFITIWSQNCSSTLKINHALFTGIGQVAAEETITAAHGPGRVVAVIDASYTMTGTAHFDEWQAFRRELKKHTISLTTTNVEVDPNDSSPGCPSLVFKKLMEQSADASGIVFFVSLPDWNLLRQYQWLPERSPVKIIVVDTAAPRDCLNRRALGGAQ